MLKLRIIAIGQLLVDRAVAAVFVLVDRVVLVDQVAQIRSARVLCNRLGVTGNCVLVRALLSKRVD